MIVNGKFHRLCQNIVGIIESTSWKRTNRIVVFGAWFGIKFADNSRYLFQYLHANKDSLGLDHVVWITSNRKLNEELNGLGYESYLNYSETAIYYLKHAGIHFICNNYDDNGYGTDIPVYYSHGAKKVNLWHGIGVVKGVAGLSNHAREGRKKHPYITKVRDLIIHSVVYRELFGAPGGWSNCYYLTPSALGQKQLSEMFYIKKNHFIMTGQPRLCECPSLMQEEIALIEEIKQFNTTYLYLPTFRTKNKNSDYTHLSEELRPVLEKENILWIEKPHDADRSAFTHEYSPNIRTLNSDFDINTIIPYVQFLITDYSSVMSDARYHSIPVILFLPDYEEYFAGDNGIIEESEILMSGPRFTDSNQLVKAIYRYKDDYSSAFYEGYEKISYDELYSLLFHEKTSLKQIWLDILSGLRIHIE